MTSSQDQGASDIEEYVRRIAAGLGVPDFVYRPAHVAKGAAWREVSDGLLVAGPRGLILQVKGRDEARAMLDTPERARAWIVKNAAAALRQVNGTRRTLEQGGQFISMRGYVRTLPAVQDWPAVVILSHGTAPDIALGRDPATAFMTLTDWMELHFRLRSTAAVIEYVERALTSGLHPALGQEHLRYERLAQADADLVATQGGVPLIPADVLHGPELAAVNLFDDLVEKVADPSNLFWDTERYLPIVELLDRQPVLSRLQVGRRMIARLREVVSDVRPRGFLALDAVRGDVLVFLLERTEDAEADEDEQHLVHLTAYGAARHHQVLESGAPSTVRTLAVGIRSNRRRGTRYAFALFEGPPPAMAPELRRHYEEKFGVFDYRAGAMRSA